MCCPQSIQEKTEIQRGEVTPLGTHSLSIIWTQNSLSVNREPKFGRMHLTSTLHTVSPCGSPPHGLGGWPRSERLTRLPLRTCNQGQSQEKGGNDRLHRPAGEGVWQPAHEKGLKQQLESCRAEGRKRVGQLGTPPRGTAETPEGDSAQREQGTDPGSSHFRVLVLPSTRPSG